MEIRKPKFFCDFCGNEVKPNAKSCPKCGKFFESVRCPRCNKTGKQSEFLAGFLYAVTHSSSNNNKNETYKKNKIYGKVVTMVGLCSLIIVLVLLFALYIYR